jgi:hypothetical protein
MQHSKTSLNWFAGESMDKINKATHMKKKELPGTVLFFALMLSLILFIGEQSTRTESTVASKMNAKPAATVDAEDTRMVKATQQPETRVQ